MPRGCASGRGTGPATTFRDPLFPGVLVRFPPVGVQLASHSCKSSAFPIDTHTDVCRIVCMATNLSIDERLLAEAKKLGHFKTKRETVNSALDEFIQRRRQMEILTLFNSIDYDSDYDYKKARTRRKAQ